MDVNGMQTSLGATPRGSVGFVRDGGDHSQRERERAGTAVHRRPRSPAGEPGLSRLSDSTRGDRAARAPNRCEVWPRAPIGPNRCVDRRSETRARKQGQARPEPSARLALCAEELRGRSQLAATRPGLGEPWSVTGQQRGRGEAEAAPPRGSGGRGAARRVVAVPSACAGGSPRLQGRERSHGRNAKMNFSLSILLSSMLPVAVFLLYLRPIRREWAGTNRKHFCGFSGPYTTSWRPHGRSGLLALPAPLLPRPGTCRAGRAVSPETAPGLVYPDTAPRPSFASRLGLGF